jgi:hypothetical protein
LPLRLGLQKWPHLCPIELPRSSSSVAVGAPDVALLDLREDSRPARRRRQPVDRVALLDWVSMVELQKINP